MRGADLQAGEAVERALEDQVRQRDRGLQRVADRVGQQAAAGQPAARFQLARAQRVHEDQHAEFLALGPERMERGLASSSPATLPPTPTPRKPSCLHRVFDLLGGEFGILQRGGGEGDEAIGVGGAELHQCLVLHLDQLGRGVASARYQ